MLLMINATNTTFIDTSLQLNVKSDEYEKILLNGTSLQARILVDINPIVSRAGASSDDSLAI